MGMNAGCGGMYQQSPYAKASGDTPASNDLRVACHPKLKERRVADGVSA
tara:strand:- start:31 stop:177 length:147 start_codon:yes stop_codon:yes gene_type:complete